MRSLVRALHRLAEALANAGKREEALAKIALFERSFPKSEVAGKVRALRLSLEAKCTSR